ncbi:MAG: hypothetical protein SPL80_10170 [Bacilli bacterium]|nr:hypothetical protein [Bacilli bacterium]
MKYKDIKEAVASMVAEHMKNGCNRDEAETRVAKASIAMFKDKKIGFMDLKYIFQILNFDFSGELAKTMEDIKKAIRVDYGITDIIRGEMKSGKTKKEATEDAIRVAYEAFREGKIEEPELLDMVLWSMGYRLTETFLLSKNQEQKNELFYEMDV